MPTEPEASRTLEREDRFQNLPGRSYPDEIGVLYDVQRPHWHLHQFTAGKKQFGVPDEEFGDSTTSEIGVRIGSLLKTENQRISYEYDFGDSWEHEIVLEKILPYQPEASGPRCIDGSRSCPPEDVGGAWGYQEFLEAYIDSGHPDHEEKLDWIGEDFDPEQFDLEQVNLNLKRSRKAAG